MEKMASVVGRKALAAPALAPDGDLPPEYWQALLDDPISPGPLHYKGKVVILVDEVSQSAAEYTAMALRVAPGAVGGGKFDSGVNFGLVRSVSLVNYMEKRACRYPAELNLDVWLR